MSVRETDVIDYVYLEDDTQTPVLVVTDPFSWKAPEDEENHLEMLREKLNSHITFVESGQINGVYPPYRGGTVRVEVVARHTLNRTAEEFYGVAKRIMADCNIDLQFRLCDA